MNGKQYWKDKIPIFIINIVCMVLLSVFLFFVGNNVDSIAVILIIWTMLLASVLTFTYHQRKRRLNRLVKMAEGLEEKYLLSEMLPEPEHAEEQVYFQLLKMASKSMLEQIGTVARERQEYREYIEQWIHEIKTPITAMKLLCENHKEPFTRELMRELEKPIALQNRRFIMPVVNIRKRIILFRKSGYLMWCIRRLQITSIFYCRIRLP